MDSITPTANLPLLPQSPADSLADKLRAGDAGSIERVAKDFEGLFLSLVLKEMRQTLEPGSLFGNDSGDVYGSLFDLFLGKHLVDAGGLGVAHMVKQYLNREDSSQESEARIPETPRSDAP
jgi:Rod binding domain-containing protein